MREIYLLLLFSGLPFCKLGREANELSNNREKKFLLLSTTEPSTASVFSFSNSENSHYYCRQVKHRKVNGGKHKADSFPKQTQCMDCSCGLFSLELMAPCGPKQSLWVSRFAGSTCGLQCLYKWF